MPSVQFLARPTLLLLVLAAALAATPAFAQSLPCSPCAGVRVASPEQAVRAAAAVAEAAAAQGTELGGEAPLVVAWPMATAGTEAEAGGEIGAVDAARRAAEAVRAAGATPWVTLRFTAPAPLLENTPHLDAEIAAAAAIARGVGDAFYQLAWRPEGSAAGDAQTGNPADDPAQYAYLLKRAAVAVTGAVPAAAGRARVASRPLPADPEALRSLYGEEIAGYLDAAVFAPAGAAARRALAETLAEVDPGLPAVTDAPLPAPPARALGVAAANAVSGVQLTLFDAAALFDPEILTSGDGRQPGAEATDPRPAVQAMAALTLLAREFSGDIAYDPYSSPESAEAWAFVRGSDLGLRVIALAPPAAGPGATGDGEAGELSILLPDPQLRNPSHVDLASGEARRITGLRRDAGVEVLVPEPGAAVVLRVERVGVEELGGGGGVAEELTVASERGMPVEEILRRLQAFEDAQARRLDHYSAVNTTHLRFGVGAGAVGGFEATFEGPYFFDPETGIDWAWETLYVNGVRWRGDTIPEIPLVQPEKAAAIPGDITFDKTYRYRLRGTEVVNGRDTWVVEFEPAVKIAETPAPDTPAGAARGGATRIPGLPGGGGAGKGDSDASLYRGTVWVDREVYARVRTRAVQLGLEGEVISNEETLTYSPVTRAGGTAGWGEDGAYVLPLRMVAQQLLSVLNGTTLVERETNISALLINGQRFADRRAEVMASDVTMVRDTDQGLRYLVPGEVAGERVVKEGFDTSKWFLAGGAFWDDSLDYPLPLGGINYLDLDFRDRGGQLNVFFAGALLAVNLAEPRLFDSRFDAGIDVFGIAVPLADSLYRDGEEILDEEVEVRPLTAALKIGRPLGSFVKWNATYRVRSRDFGATDDTAEDFTVPSDHLEHNFQLSGRFTRSGYSLGLNAAYATRSEWEPWGFAGNPGYSEDHEEFLYWGASLAKNWYLPRFQKIGAELVYVDGEDLDRFSKYEFGFFGETRIHGYRSSRVRAERAYLARASYGFEIGKLLRLDAQVDTALASDEASGLEDEFLAGVGLAGSFVGPWQTLINLDVGTPVAGPDDGVVAYLVFLKLF